jgi:hypothetical protein
MLWNMDRIGRHMVGLLRVREKWAGGIHDGCDSERTTHVPRSVQNMHNMGSGGGVGDGGIRKHLTYMYSELSGIDSKQIGWMGWDGTSGCVNDQISCTLAMSLNGFI